MSKIVQALAVAAVATAALSGVAKEAEASSYKHIHVVKFGQFHKPYVHYGFKPYGFYQAGYVAPVYHATGCGFYLHKWQATGLWFWKHKYLSCKY